ncbi:uncharacterized membrane protein isoform X1 [Tanacetum coccineum]
MADRMINMPKQRLEALIAKVSSRQYVQTSFRDGLRESVSHLPILTDSIMLVLVLSLLAEVRLRHGELITIFGAVVKPTLGELLAYGYPVQGSSRICDALARFSELLVQTSATMRFCFPAEFGVADSDQGWLMCSLTGVLRDRFSSMNGFYFSIRFNSEGQVNGLFSDTEHKDMHFLTLMNILSNLESIRWRDMLNVKIGKYMVNGRILFRDGLIDVKDIEECIVKARCKKLAIKLPAWSILQCLLALAKSESSGLVI